MTRIPVSKLDAARRQLRTAIELWFADGDPVSTHTLAFAAYEIIHCLFRNHGHKDLLFDTSLIKDEYRGEFARFMKDAASFFKHANTDAGRTIDFDPSMSEIFLFMSVVGIQVIGHALNDAEFALVTWHQIHHPTWFSQNKIFKDGVPIETIEQVKSIAKGDFFKAFLEVIPRGAQ